MITISLCMIVKNEEKVLARCLDSIADLMDEIIIVDTGSSDNTKEIAKKYTDKIYDFAWIDDFSAARNYSFSKATKEYIYVADADEVIDADNHRKLAELKEVLIPEIEIVQMRYCNQLTNGTAYNFDEEYRPKLYKRQREFTWIEPVHEMVRLDPVVYDSEIDILHMPESVHSSRDFAVFQKQIQKGQRLSKRLHHMYAMELFRSGRDDDFLKSENLFKRTLEEDGRTIDEVKEAFCVLARCYRVKGDIVSFMECALKDAATSSCAEICCELGMYYESVGNISEAVMWYQNALTETESILDIRSSQEIPKEALERLD